MAILFRKKRALNRVLRNILRAASAPATPAEAPRPASPAYSLCADIPQSYNDSYVRFIPKDPQHTFVYWNHPADGVFGNHRPADGISGVPPSAGSDVSKDGCPRAANANAATIEHKPCESNKQEEPNHNCLRENKQQHFDFATNSWSWEERPAPPFGAEKRDVPTFGEERTAPRSCEASALSGGNHPFAEVIGQAPVGSAYVEAPRSALDIYRSQVYGDMPSVSSSSLTGGNVPALSSSAFCGGNLAERLKQ